MYIKDEHYFPKDMRLPTRMLHYLGIHILCELTPDEVKGISDGLFAFDAELTFDPPAVYPPLNSSLIITDKEELTFTFVESDSSGLAVRLSILHAARWRRFGDQEAYKRALLSTLEELCHIHYLVDDELLVKRRVSACVQRLLPDCRYEDLYDPDWQP